KAMATGGGMTARSNITEPQYSVAELAAIRRESHRLGRRVTAHSHAGKGQRNCLAARIEMREECTGHTHAGRAVDEDRMAESGRPPVSAGHACTGLAGGGIGPCDVAGALGSGKAADVLVVDGDLSADIRAITRTRHVLRGGPVVAAGGWVRTTSSATPGQ